MNTSQVAIYARVSSEPRPEAPTIASQVAALQQRVAADGFTLPESMRPRVEPAAEERARKIQAAIAAGVLPDP